MTPREKFAENLRRLRAKRKLSQEKVAKLAEVHRTEISLLERGEREPRLGTLLKLSAVLEAPPRAFFDGIEWVAAPAANRAAWTLPYLACQGERQQSGPNVAGAGPAPELIAA